MIPLMNIIRLLVLCFAIAAQSLQAAGKVPVRETRISLNGSWGFELDPEDKGLGEGWQFRTPDDTIILPGAIHDQGKGYPVTANTSWYSGRLSDIWYKHPMYAAYRKDGNVKIFDFLQPETYYVGPAWYVRKVEVPDSFRGQHLTLFLERVHWGSTLFINGRKVGECLALGTPHEYDVTDVLHPGTNTIALRIDNSKIIDTGRIPHSTSDQTMAAWNGVIGEMYVEARDPVWIEDVSVFPNLADACASVRVMAGNMTGRVQKARLAVSVECYNTDSPCKGTPVTKSLHLETSKGSVTQFDIPIPGKMQTWDEFSPTLYRLNITLSSGKYSDSRSITFGMREVHRDGKSLYLNGERLLVRGNLYCGESPVNGMPHMDVQWWRDVLGKHREFGHNAIRFHSWCPPEAAFVAADEIGIYLQPEVDEWSEVFTDVQEEFFRDEAGRMNHYYANHPSFLLLAMGNEKVADTVRLRRFLSEQHLDPRHLVGGKLNGRPDLPEADFYSTHNIKGKNMRHHVGWPPRQSNNLLYRQKPGSSYDYSEGMALYDKPFLSHEVGQYCVFPDYEKELPKYTGSMHATVLEIQRDQMAERGMSHLASSFTMATGKWQMRLLKAEYEALLKTEDLTGFWSLSLQDFTGQGTAPVGVMDAFWDTKMYASSEEFRMFCDTTVILARIPEFQIPDDGVFSASMELYHAGRGPLPASVLSYNVTDCTGRVLSQGELPVPPAGNHSPNTQIGKIEIKDVLPRGAAKYYFNVSLGGTPVHNRWEFWTFPSVSAADPGNVKIVREMDDETFSFLANGGKVLWVVDGKSLKGRLPVCFASIYWTSIGLNGGETMCNSIFCDPSHPLFKGFPTEEHSNWQWWDVLRYSHPMILDEFGATIAFPKDYFPVLQVIDSWKINRKLALAAECKYGKGSLLVTSIDFSSDMDSRPVTRFLYSRILDYMNSADFNPSRELSSEIIMSILGDNYDAAHSSSGVLPTEG